MQKKKITKNHKKRLEYLSTYFRELRFAEGLTQEELSKYVNVHRNTIQRAENADNITLLSTFELADALGIKIKDLFFDME